MNARVWITGLVVALLFGPRATLADNPKKIPPIKSVIDFSTAPWDGAAYQILVPWKDARKAPNAFLRIDIWGRPQFPGARRLQFSGQTDSKASGRACFQTALNQSAPVSLAGSIFFESLQKGRPVSGSFDFSSVDGQKFRGRFLAIWGEEKGP